MLKMISMVLVSLVTTSLIVSCKSKPKDADTPVGGVEGQNLTPETTNAGIGTDSCGSDCGKIPGLNTVHFDYDSSTIGSEARRQLGENATWIKANTGVTVQIEGHCDSRGSVEYNLALGERRAKAVKNYLTTLGIDSKRLTILSYGEEKPIATGDSEDAFAKNRRANFVPLAQ